MPVGVYAQVTHLCNVSLCIVSYFYDYTLQLEKGLFLNLWKGIDESKEVYSTVMDLPTVNIDAISQKFARSNIFHIAKRSVVDNTVRSACCCGEYIDCSCDFF